MKKKSKAEEYCSIFSYCKQKYAIPLGLQWHEERDPLHNYRPQQIASINSSSTALISLLSSNSGENHSISKRNARQKIFKTYQMVDESIVSSMDENQINSTDMNEFTKDDDEMISDDDNDFNENPLRY
jgi:transcriptional regulator with AAA-type ATPase domain